MCLICVDFQLQKMTLQDARRAYREMANDMAPGHAEEVSAMLTAAERRQAMEDAAAAAAVADDDD